MNGTIVIVTNYVATYDSTDSDYSWNAPLIQESDVDVFELWRAQRAAAIAGIKRLLAWHARILRPWLLIAKRFDFRSAPRWSRRRWRAKT